MIPSGRRTVSPKITDKKVMEANALKTRIREAHLVSELSDDPRWKAARKRLLARLATAEKVLDEFERYDAREIERALARRQEVRVLLGMVDSAQDGISEMEKTLEALRKEIDERRSK